MVQTKKCSKCGNIKSIEHFDKTKNGKYGVRGECKICRSKIWNEYYKINVERLRKRCEEYRKNNLEYFKKHRKSYWINNIEKLKEKAHEFRRNNAEKINENNREYRKRKPEKAKEFSKRGRGKRMANPIYKLNQAISISIHRSLRSGKGGHHWETLVNFNLQELISHLEKQFKEGMNWGNQGKWHIDHILPVSLWQFENYGDREFKQCWALCNLQPLWAIENISKGNRINNQMI